MPKKKFNPDWCFILLASLLILRLTNLVTVNYVSGDSMYPTLKDGQIVIGSNIKSLTNQIEYKDIIVLKEGNKLLVKRVVAKPNDKIEIKENILYVNDVPQEEEYANFTYPSVFMDVEELVLQDNEYFVLGDNRHFSRDSRSYGPINEKQIISVLMHNN